MIYYKTEKKFREEMLDYVNNSGNYVKSTIRQYATDAFNTLDSDKGIDFWEMLGNAKLSEMAQSTVEDFWIKWTNFHGLHVKVNNHSNMTAGIRRVNDFVKTKPEWLETIREESKEVNSYIYNRCKEEFKEGYDEEKRATLISEFKEKFGPHPESEYDLRILNYAYIVGIYVPPKTDDIFRIMTDIMQETLLNMDKADLLDAINRIKDNIISTEYNVYYRYEHRRNWLIDLAEKNNIEIDLSDNIFKEGYKVLNEYAKTDLWTVVDKIEYKDDQDIIYINNEESLNERISSIPEGNHLVTIENIKIDKDDEYFLIFKNGLYVTGIYEVIENIGSGSELKLKLIDSRKRLWYQDTYPHNFTLITADRAWRQNEFNQFILEGKKQDIELYAKRFHKEIPTVTEEDDMKSHTDDIFMSDREIKELTNLIIKKKNVILQGAPGVGKTFSAKKLAYSIMGVQDDSRLLQIQFHQSYSYEDLIMGYRPTENGFELKTGPFYEFCKIAENDLDNEYFFIIDEINRGNISKIFGELLMLIEPDKRGEEHAIILLYNDETFYVPENVHIIGMMNTADRSLAMIDYAFRRRFAFYELLPAFENDKFIQSLNNTGNYKLKQLVKQLQDLNKEIESDDSLGRGFQIGHSYVTKTMKVEDGEVASIIKFEIIPLIEEYWFDDEQQIQKWSSRLLGVLSE